MAVGKGKKLLKYIFLGFTIDLLNQTLGVVGKTKIGILSKHLSVPNVF